MNKIKTMLAILMTVIIFAGCGIKNENAEIIKVNDLVITQSEFDKAFNASAGEMLKSMGLSLKKNPQNAIVLMAKEQILSQLIVNKLIEKIIEDNNITVSDEEIKEAEKEVLSRFPSKDQFLQILKENGATYDEFLYNLGMELKVKKYVDSISKAKITTADAKKYYRENLDKFSYPKQVRASHILIEANPNAIKLKLQGENKTLTEDELNRQVNEEMEKAKKKTQELQIQAKKKPSNFAKLARENSQDRMTAVKGGDLGFFNKEDMVPEFSNAAFSLKPNTISNVVQTPYGYHIIMVTEKKEAGKRSFEAAKKEIITMLETQDKLTVFKNKIDELRKDSKIEYLDDRYNVELLKKKALEAAKTDPKSQDMIERAYGSQNNNKETGK